MNRIVLFLALCLTVGATNCLLAQTDTSFTYQGELQQNGAPVNGEFGLVFTLWDSIDAGNQIGTVNAFPPVLVENGRFTVDLDFGAESLEDSRWLQIRVNGTTLSPRTKISAAPFALQTRGLSVDADQRVGIGISTPQGRLHVLNADPNEIALIAGNSSTGYALRADSASDVTPSGGGVVLVGNESALNIAFDQNEIMARNNGTTSDLLLNNEGGNVLVGPNSGATTRFITPILEVTSPSDVTETGGGAVIVGFQSGPNIAIDRNEIMARNAGRSADLFLNLDGGNIFAGRGGSDTVLSAPILSITGGSDFSEMFDVRSEQKIEPGMLVVIDEKNPGSLVPSSQVNDCRVAGIISGAGGVKTGMTMGQKGSIADGKYPVALTGRVYCFADASNSAIKPGDMLTTSSTIGHAMKVEDRVSAIGAIIGKAMTGLKQGEKGLVLVLVNLQ